jgi:hypothetical protein
VRVAFPVGIRVVVPVMADPPEWPVLAGENPEQGQQELERTGSPERPMGQKSMITGGYAENLERARDQESRYCDATPANDKNEAASEMQQD